MILADDDDDREQGWSAMWDPFAWMSAQSTVLLRGSVTGDYVLSHRKGGARRRAEATDSVTPLDRGLKVEGLGRNIELSRQAASTD